MREYMREYNARPERKALLRANAKHSYRTRRGYLRVIFRKYGISAEEFDRRLVGQCSRCAICTRPLNPSTVEPHVDHCHRTMAVRGLLCHGCNMGLGGFRDDTEALKAAVGYVEQTRPFEQKEPATETAPIEVS